LPIIPALRRLKQEEFKFEDSLSYIVRPCQKQANKQKKKPKKKKRERRKRKWKRNLSQSDEAGILKIAESQNHFCPEGIFLKGENLKVAFIVLV
jgi:hypothetical protein